jgi:hypothetical protein
VIYVKSILAGIIAVAVCEMLLVAVSTIVMMSMLGGGGYWVFDPRALVAWTVLLPNVLSFVVGFAWMFRRKLKRPTPSL